MHAITQTIPLNSLTPIHAFNNLAGEEEAVLLHSASRDRYSFICSNPFLTFKAKAKNCQVTGEENYEKTTNPFQELRSLLKKYSNGFESKGFNFFSGGAVGLVSYDAGRLIERLPSLAVDDLQLPDFYFIFPKNVAVFDHEEKKIVLCALGEKEEAEKEIKGMKQKLAHSHANKQSPSIPSIQLSSNSSRKQFEQSVEKAREYIKKGDIFQANLSHRFSGKTSAKPVDIYETLAKINPSPFAGFLQTPEFQLISCSPERLVKVEGKRIDARPIAGTRPRGRNKQEDEQLMNELIGNEKEKAEHVMLVDLARNDLGRVSEFGSVKVNELFTVEKYSHVQHLVSNVQAVMNKQSDCIDVLQSVFPGGTITGAPKVRSMEVIEELEPTRRGPFYGSLGYIGFDGRMDFNILIRTILMKKQTTFVQVGSGIVLDSDPKKEFLETMHKAQAMLNAVNAGNGVYLSRKPASLLDAVNATNGKKKI